MTSTVFRIAQDFEYVGNDYWHWWSWIAGSDADLDRIDKVVWLLHPSFAQSRCVADDRATNFRLDASGWGTFLLRAQVQLKDGSQQSLRRNLRLEYPEDPAPAPRRATSRPAGFKAKSVFLSYSSLDARIAARVREQLQNAGLQVFDQTKIEPGAPWEETLSGMIVKSDAVVGVIGDTEVSPWVAMELGMASGLAKPTLALLTPEAGDLKLPRQVQVERLGLESLNLERISALLQSADGD